MVVGVDNRDGLIERTEVGDRRSEVGIAGWLMNNLRKSVKSVDGIKMIERSDSANSQYSLFNIQLQKGG